jgi:hypothetical protein
MNNAPDTWSPRAIRIGLAVLAVALTAGAWLLDGWPVRVLAALAVLCAGAAIIPPYRHPHS